MAMRGFLSSETDAQFETNGGGDSWDTLRDASCLLDTPLGSRKHSA